MSEKATGPGKQSHTIALGLRQVTDFHTQLLDTTEEMVQNHKLPPKNPLMKPSILEEGHIFLGLPSQTKSRSL